MRSEIEVKPVGGSTPVGEAGAVWTEWHGVELALWPQRAVFVPSEGALLVADLHLGKAGAFRLLGSPVPEGVTGADLRRLSDAIAATGARRLVVLGDLFHSKHGRVGLAPALEAWRASHAGLDVTLIRGNHDRSAGDPAASLGFEVVDGPLGLGPFDLVHEPPVTAPQRPTIAAHVHPAVSLRGAAGGMRSICFWFAQDLCVLPAFGAFTGTRVVRPGRGDRVFVVGDRAVIGV